MTPTTLTVSSQHDWLPPRLIPEKTKGGQVCRPEIPPPSQEVEVGGFGVQGHLGHYKFKVNLGFKETSFQKVTKGVGGG